MAPFPQAEAEAAVAAALAMPLREAFTAFGPPVAAASIAQVHRAEADGQTVAVKVLRPGIERRFRSDLDTLYFAARTAERHSAEARRLRLIEVVDTLARSVTIEMDLRLEAAAIAEMRENVKDDPDFRVPTVDWERTARGVLTLEWIDGTPLSDRKALEARGLDLPALGRALMQTFLRHALRDGFFHADMHPGNLFVDADGRHRRGRFRHHGPARRRRSGASSPRSSTASSRATITAPPKCISRPATCRRIIRWKASRRRSARSASRSTTSRRPKSRWRSC